jgi:nitroimidazol reductase NimA-like FMN-containing flavoprotein (pyridoxamine 5'-phosphate oxidase superfamily)
MPTVATTRIYPPIHGQAVDTIVAVLDRERLMSIAVNRPDGWPQVSTVGYVNDGFNLFFVTGRESQKLANITADSRVSVAIRSSAEHGAFGVSMAARAHEVSDNAVADRVNKLVWARHRPGGVSCPATSSVAIIQLVPELVCDIRAVDGRSHTECFSLGDAGHPSRDGSGLASAGALLF